MSAAEEMIKAGDPAVPATRSVLDQFVDFVSSVRFGVTLLCILVLLAMVGMLIMQQNVEGFDSYFVSLTPAEKLVFGALGIFDIYNSWYFNGILLLLSLNIVLASIDHFPAAWTFISRPKLDASRKWLLGQKQNAVVTVTAPDRQAAAEKVQAVFRENGLKVRITEKGGKLFVFGESGRLNRLGAYIVHVFLLTLFLGHFVANTTGEDADVRLAPGDKTDRIGIIKFDLEKKQTFDSRMPFVIECLDISQKLIDMKGSVDASNTMDWSTRIRIDDPEYGVTEANVSLNNPFSYRGYRFFQSQAISLGNARTMKLDLIPEKDGDLIKLDLVRNGSADLPDGTKVEFESFQPDFVMNAGKPDTKTGEYNNPAVVLGVTPPGGEKTRVFAFANKLPDNAPINAPKAGYRWRLTEFEKVPAAHILSIKYDPFQAAFIAWYIGGFGLIGALGFVFFVSHKRIWAIVENSDTGCFEIPLGGNTNRNQFGFEDKFNKIAGELDHIANDSVSSAVASD
jgi:cytochrome c biogenesis protein